MKLTDADINCFVSKVLKLPQGKREEYLDQVDFLIGRLESKIKEDGSFRVTGFKKTGSLVKGTVLRPKGDDGVDADVAVNLDLSEADKSDIQLLHQIILKLVRAVYPQKSQQDFQIQPRTLGIHFRDSGLDVEPSAQKGDPIKTSVQGQLDFIRKRSDSDSSYRTLVRLVKKWRNVQELDSFRSFLIELVLAHIQDTQGASSTMEDGLERFFLYITQSKLLERIAFPENGVVKNFPKDTVVILDPVNPENNVAKRLTDAERKEITSKAETAWEKLSTASFTEGKGETVELWKSVFGRSFTIED